MKDILKSNSQIREKPETKMIHKEIRNRKPEHVVKVTRDGKMNYNMLRKLSLNLKKCTFNTNHKAVEYQLIHNILPSEWYFTQKMGLPKLNFLF